MPQTKLDTGDAGPAPVRAVVRLAHRGACLSRTRDASGGNAFAVLSPRNGFAKPLMTLNSGEFEYCLLQGWLTEHAPDEWVLSRKGMVAAQTNRGGGQSADQGLASRAVPESAAPVKVTEPPLAWLRRRTDRDGRALISAVQWEAGERLQADFWFALMTPRTTANWDFPAAIRRDRRAAPGSGVELIGNIAAARERVRSALAAVGPELSGILFDVCGQHRGLEDAERAAGWPRRTAKIVLQLALTSLARHYGLIPTNPIRRDEPAPLRHWGTDDYRPTLDEWK